mmetsp:Transcript_33280/g.99119  ORF Transcript_33280/g.99119 Transcript_33280/m.99119 type:complete len:389 (+) Transcript_33280:137-1303(+)
MRGRSSPIDTEAACIAVPDAGPDVAMPCGGRNGDSSANGCAAAASGALPRPDVERFAHWRCCWTIALCCSAASCDWPVAGSGGDDVLGTGCCCTSAGGAVSCADGCIRRCAGIDAMGCDGSGADTLGATGSGMVGSGAGGGTGADGAGSGTVLLLDENCTQSCVPDIPAASGCCMNGTPCTRSCACCRATASACPWSCVCCCSAPTCSASSSFSRRSPESRRMRSGMGPALAASTGRVDAPAAGAAPPALAAARGAASAGGARAAAVPACEAALYALLASGSRSGSAPAEPMQGCDTTGETAVDAAAGITGRLCVAMARSCGGGMVGMTTFAPVVKPAPASVGVSVTLSLGDGVSGSNSWPGRRTRSTTISLPPTSTTLTAMLSVADR